MKKRTKIEVEIEITNAMRDLGIPANLKGYHYIRHAVMLTIDDPEATSSVTKILYPEVAKKYKTTVQKAERAIRTAIESTFNRDPEHFQAYFGVTCWKIRPTNSEFIAILADSLRLKMR